jgi:hypothetical protein
MVASQPSDDRGIGMAVQAEHDHVASFQPEVDRTARGVDRLCALDQPLIRTDA